eukprot:PhM_4_TR9056/c0_g1_i1/m.60015
MMAPVRRDTVGRVSWSIARDVFHSLPKGMRIARSYCSADVYGKGTFVNTNGAGCVSAFSLITTCSRPASRRFFRSSSISILRASSRRAWRAAWRRLSTFDCPPHSSQPGKAWFASTGAASLPTASSFSFWSSARTSSSAKALRIRSAFVVDVGGGLTTAASAAGLFAAFFAFFARRPPLTSSSRSAAGRFTCPGVSTALNFLRNVAPAATPRPSAPASASPSIAASSRFSIARFMNVIPASSSRALSNGVPFGSDDSSESVVVGADTFFFLRLCSVSLSSPLLRPAASSRADSFIFAVSCWWMRCSSFRASRASLSHMATRLTCLTHLDVFLCFSVARSAARSLSISCLRFSAAAAGSFSCSSLSSRSLTFSFSFRIILWYDFERILFVRFLFSTL